MVGDWLAQCIDPNSDLYMKDGVYAVQNDS
jgi:hypothetical protein